MISFIIPTLDEISVLEPVLEALREYHGPHEIIVSDGNSTDGTIALAQRYADHVLVYRDAARQTIAQAKNSGAAIARGEFLVFLDADVTIRDPNPFFARALALFDADPLLKGLMVRLRVWPQIATWADTLIFGIGDIMHFLNNNILGIAKAPGEFQMVRANAFHAIGGYDEHLPVGEDHDFFHRLGKIGRTHMEWSLSVWHTSRRAHAIGWPRLLTHWTLNGLSMALHHRSAFKEWKVIR